MSHTYQVRKDLRPKSLDGISEDQLDQHWTLYEGYVKNVNLLNGKLSELRGKGDFGPEFSELTRRLGFEYNGMVMHELYFEAMKPGQTPLDHAAGLTKLIKEFFGGYETWQKEFAAMGKMRGVGWVVLYYDPRSKTLSNHWITLHEDGHIAGFQPIIVMDVWEHAYMVDFSSSGRGKYVEAFFKNIDWHVAEKRLTQTASIPGWTPAPSSSSRS